MSLFWPNRSSSEAVLRAYKKGEFTDLTITCGTLIFNVHRLVVCTSCDFFKRSLKFAVGKEAEELHIDLPEDDPEMIRRLIAYLYLGDYDPTSGSTIDVLKFSSLYQHESSTDTATIHHSRYRKEISAFPTQDNCACLSPNPKNVTQPMEEVQTATAPSDYKVVTKPDNMVEVENPLTIHAAMYALGDKYQVDGLCNTAKEKFRSCLHHHAHSEDFIAATQAVYSTTPESNRGLRDVVVAAFRSQFRVDVTQIPGAEEKLDTIDELSFALIKSWPTKTEPAQASSSNAVHGLFGGNAKTPSTQASSNNAGQGLFGGANRSSTPSLQASSRTGGLFGGGANQSSTPSMQASSRTAGGLFGGGANQSSIPSQRPAGSPLFGGSTAPASPPTLASALDGFVAGTTEANGRSPFGNQTTTPATTNLFGATFR